MTAQLDPIVPTMFDGRLLEHFARVNARAILRMNDAQKDEAIADLERAALAFCGWGQPEGEQNFELRN